MIGNCIAKRMIFLIIFACLLFCPQHVYAQSEQNNEWLLQYTQDESVKWQKERAQAESLATTLGMPIRQEFKDGKVIELQRFHDGVPMYYITHNLNAARTVSTDKVWPGGSFGFSLTGSSETLGIWDGGRASNTHQELNNRIIYGDNATVVADHSTHVGGTMIAGGVQTNARGMSYQSRLRSFDWNNDASEMASAAALGLRVSNHAYGYITGWRNEDTIWRWWGNAAVSDTEDYNFGFYNSYSQNWDNIARNAPYYLIVKASGNDRREGPSTQPVAHYYYTSGQWVRNNSTVRKLDGGVGGYDCISHMGVAKNILTIGSVNDIVNGYTQPSNVVLAEYSGCGPTDDGRIKPDIVANGEGVYSSVASSNSAYATYLGTSCAVANVSGSVGLLLQCRKNYFGNSPLRSSTIKGLIIHTADEAGPNPGPDYMFGWGLMNTLKAVQLMKTDSAAGRNFNIREEQLVNNSKIEFPAYCNGSQPLRVTICWTDPAGTPPTPSLNPTTRMLVNDVDLRVIGPDSMLHYPWVLDRTNPSAAASKDDNIRDNVEQVYIASPSAGLYTIRINHKGTLSGGSQFVSVLVSGITRINKDIGVTAIVIPTSTIDSSSAITPRVKVINNGVNSETFNVTFKIGNNYTSTRSKSLRSGIEDTVNFTPWIPIRGTHVTLCSTYLAGDEILNNNKRSDSVKTQVKNIGIIAIESPASIIESTGTPVIPSVRIKNFGTNPETFNVNFRITNTAFNQNRVKTLQPGEEDTTNFSAWSPGCGTFRARCSTFLASDVVRTNDTLSKSVIVLEPNVSTWLPRQNISAGAGNKAVKSGGSLVAGAQNKIYAFKGNNTREFYSYDIEQDVWSALESIPDDPINRKRVNKGAALAYNSDTMPNFVYAVKGNKTLEFWAYDVNAGRWFRKREIPSGNHSVKIKGGTGISYLLNRTEQFVYLLKGSGTFEFYAYHCQGDSWIKNLEPAPSGRHLKPYKDGSCMTTDGNNLLYVLKGGGTNNEFYSYNILSNIWTTLESIPAYSARTIKKTKVKDGASICYNGDSLIYAVKGGNNQEFWRYNINRNRWQELDTLPKSASGKKIGSGAGMVFTNSLVYLLKGNKTLEMWMYRTPVTSYYKSQMLNINVSSQEENSKPKTENSKVMIEVIPNPISNNSIIKFNLIQQENVKITLYNSAGQLLTTYYSGELNSGVYSIPMTSTNLSAGVYHLQCQIGNDKTTVKIVVR